MLSGDIHIKKNETSIIKFKSHSEMVIDVPCDQTSENKYEHMKSVRKKYIFGKVIFLYYYSFLEALFLFQTGFERRAGATLTSKVF